MHCLSSGAPLQQEFWLDADHSGEGPTEQARICRAVHGGKFDCAIQGYIDSSSLLAWVLMEIIFVKEFGPKP